MSGNGANHIVMDAISAMQPKSKGWGSFRAAEVLAVGNVEDSDRDRDVDMDNQNVIVAVRVRPPNTREMLVDDECMIQMEGSMTTLREGKKGKEYKFTYDHSFWSFNDRDAHFANQEHVFNCVGVPLVTKAFQGYNCCLFAYGQTGSGKSYTMMGNRGTTDRGVIPRFSENMWAKIKENPDIQYQVEVSYFEIYSEQIFDLLVKPSMGSKTKLKVRHNWQRLNNSFATIILHFGWTALEHGWNRKTLLRLCH